MGLNSHQFTHVCSQMAGSAIVKFMASKQLSNFFGVSLLARVNKTLCFDIYSKHATHKTSTNEIILTLKQCCLKLSI